MEIMKISELKLGSIIDYPPYGYIQLIGLEPLNNNTNEPKYPYQYMFLVLEKKDINAPKHDKIIFLNGNEIIET